MKIDQRHPIDRRGYALLVVMAALVAIVTALSLLARQTLRRGQSAAADAARLHDKWATWSIRQTVLAEAPAMFTRRHNAYMAIDPSDRSPTPPRPVLSETVVLSGIRYDLRVDDENAKADLNRMIQLGTPGNVEKMLIEALPPGLVRLQPSGIPDIAPEVDAADDGNTQSNNTLDDAIVTAAPRVLRSWGEVIDLTRLGSLRRSDVLPAIASDLSIAGGTTLNLPRADDAAIERTLRSVLGQPAARRIVTRYRSKPNLDPDTLLRREVSSDRRRRQLAKLLGSTSDAFTIWIDATAPTFRRRSVHTRRPTAQGQTQTTTLNF